MCVCVCVFVHRLWSCVCVFVHKLWSCIVYIVCMPIVCYSCIVEFVVSKCTFEYYYPYHRYSLELMNTFGRLNSYS